MHRARGRGPDARENQPGQPRPPLRAGGGRLKRPATDEAKVLRGRPESLRGDEKTLREEPLGSGGTGPPRNGRDWGDASESNVRCASTVSGKTKKRALAVQKKMEAFFYQASSPEDDGR